jgi:hypothetical protein
MRPKDTVDNQKVDELFNLMPLRNDGEKMSLEETCTFEPVGLLQKLTAFL